MIEINDMALFIGHKDTIEEGLLDTWHDCLLSLHKNLGIDEKVDDRDFVAVRAAVATLLLANDSTIIQPDVLADDRRRFDESIDPEFRQRLIDKARKRGIVGWRIGEVYETIPHFRRPHFGLRHTGKGRTIPKIVPIKGSTVHRDKLTKVPTGHIDEDGRELEA